MLRRALPQLRFFCNIIRASTCETSVLVHVNSYKLLSGCPDGASGVTPPWLGPLNFQRSFAAHTGTLLVQFPLAQTGEGAPARDVSTSLQLAAKGPTWQQKWTSVQTALIDGMQRRGLALQRSGTNH